MAPDIFHRDFTPTPYWWEAYRPVAGELVDVPRSARVAIVGGGYAGLSTALELRGELQGHGGNRRVVAVVGDGSLTGGMAYEALNNLGHSGRRCVR